MNTITQYAFNFLTVQSLHLLILFTFILGITLILRHKSSHLRYLLWLLIIAKCLIPPLHTIPLALLPTSTPSQVQIISAPPASPTAKTSTAEIQQANVNSYIPAPQQIEPQVSQSNKPAILQARPIQVSESEPAWQLTVSYEKWIPAVWLTGIVLFCLVIIGKAIRFHLYLRAHRTDLTQETHPAIFEFLSAALPDKKPLRVYQLSRPGQPFVWGLPRGAIYLPANFADVNDSHKQQSILMHEAGHIMRMDPLVNFLQVIAQGVFWFHPLVWIANRMIRAEREKCCDEFAVAALNTAPRHYCNAIVEALMTAHPVRPAIPTLAVAGPAKNIEDRIKTLLTPGKIFRRRPTVRALIVITLLAAIIVPTTIALTHKATPPDYTLSGSVIDADGKPIAGAIVFDDGYGPQPYQKGITDAAGIFEYKSWNEEHNITAKADDYTPQTITFTTWPFDNSKQLNFKLHRVTEADPAALPEGATEAMLLPEYIESHTVLSLKTGQLIPQKQADDSKEPYLFYAYTFPPGENPSRYTVDTIPEKYIGIEAGNMNLGGFGWAPESNALQGLWSIEKSEALPECPPRVKITIDNITTNGSFVGLPLTVPELEKQWPFITAFKGDDGTRGIFEITGVQDRKIHVRYKTLTNKPLLQSESETKPQISISMRAISVLNDDTQLQSLFETAGIHMPQFSMSVSQDGKNTAASDKLTYGQSALLTSGDVELILKAVQSNPDSKLLTAPQAIVWSGEAATIQISTAQAVPQGQKQFSLHITPSLMPEGILSEFEIMSSDNIEIENNQIEETTLLKSKVLIPQDKTLLILGPNVYQEFLDKQPSSTKPQRRLLILLETREYDDTNPAPSSNPNTMSPNIGGMGEMGGMSGGMGGTLSSSHSPFTATLPNGVTIELVGLGTAPWKSEQQWWKPDGTSMDLPVLNFSYPLFEWKNQPNGAQFTCAALCKIQNDANIDISVPNATFSNGLILGASFRGAETQLIYLTWPPFLGDVPVKTDMRMAVGTGEFIRATRLGKYTPHQHQQYSLGSDSFAVILHPLRTGSLETPCVDLTCNQKNKDTEFRVFAKLKNSETEQWHGGGIGGEVLFFQSTPKGRNNTKIENIEDIIIEYRSYEWITFKNISLRPGIKTEVDVVIDKRQSITDERTETSREKKEVFLPGISCVLDLSTGEVTTILVEGKSPAECFDYARQHCGCGVMFDHDGDTSHIGFINVQQIDRPTRMEKGVLTMSFDSEKVPLEMVIAGSDGNRYAVNILKAENAGCTIEYARLPDSTSTDDSLRPGEKMNAEIEGKNAEAGRQTTEELSPLSIPAGAGQRVSAALHTLLQTMSDIDSQWNSQDNPTALADLFDRINEACDDLQGKNGTEIPDVPEWGQLPPRLVDILERLHTIEETAEGCRSLAAANQRELLEQHWQTLKDHYNILCLFLKPKQQANTKG